MAPLSHGRRCLCLTVLTVTMIAAGSLGGCSRGAYEVPSPAPTATLVAAACPRDAAELGLTATADNNGGGQLPSDFSPVDVIWCRVDGVDNAGPGQARYQLSERVSRPSQALVDALKAPDMEDPNATCSLEAEGPVYLLLVDSEARAVHVRLPEDACGHFRPEALSALDQLTFSTRSEFSVTVAGNDR